MHRILVFAALSVGVLAGCAHTVSSLPAQQSNAAFIRQPKVTHKSLYEFGAAPGDGEHPLGALTLANGLLYGTTLGGGSAGSGTVFEVSQAGTERVVFDFSGAKGLRPFAGLIESNGALYGTTHAGGTSTACGANGCGTAFEVHPDGAQRVLYSLRGGSDGSYPRGGLLEYNGVLYGTTSAGGDAGLGTIYEIEPSGVEHVLYSFHGGSSDGAFPESALIRVNNVFYGTTRVGGQGAGCAALGPGLDGCGTAFAFDPSTGKERLVYAFTSGADGSLPHGNLLDVNGVLYGTTSRGGTGTCGTGLPSGCGTVFALQTNGTEKVIVSFRGGNDGADPQAGLTLVNGKLYGTTYSGGASSTCSGGCGTVFELSATYSKRVLYNFGGSPDGANPSASLFDMSGTLYGTTYRGGKADKGTIFAVTP